MPTTLKEGRVILALQAIQNDEKLSLRAAARLYNIPYNKSNYPHSEHPTFRTLVMPHTAFSTPSLQLTTTQSILSQITSFFGQ